MHLTFRNVNQAFYELVKGIHSGEIPTTKRGSRYGDVMQVEEPVLVTYTHPRERVLLNSQRDCNPFFHVYEALYLLTGRRDVAPLTYYNSRMSEFSDDGKVFNASYGYRWRNHYHGEPSLRYWADEDDWKNRERIDQLDEIVAHLKAKPDSRRAVLQMWNVEDDLLRIDTHVDVACNTSVMFSLREQQFSNDTANMGDGEPRRYLDMTVTNRSNDLVWGLTGANYCHFGFLLEYMAARLGVEVGVYNQFSNNVHCYLATWKADEWLDEYTAQGVDPLYLGYPYHHLPLVKDPAVFEKELPVFVENYSGGEMLDAFYPYSEPFLSDVAVPMMDAFLSYKRHTNTVMKHVERIKADDWRLVAKQWMKKRLAKRQASISEGKS